MSEKKRVIALGFFDGVHLGHKALLDETLRVSKEQGLTPSVISFDLHPHFMVTGRQVPLINTPYERAEMIERNFGITDLIYLHFDSELMHMSWERFVEWLVNDFNAGWLVAGYDFSFGYKGEGDPQKLQTKCAELGVGCSIMDKVLLDGVTVSSTYIRGLLSEGDVETANRFLAHPHIMTDRVRYGYRIGRTIGVPTINMRFTEGVIELLRGVYATKVFLEDDREYLAVTNVGIRPTVSGTSREETVESHILDFDGNLYGKRIRVEFHKYLRPEQKFEAPGVLKMQIQRDIAMTRAHFGLKSSNLSDIKTER